MLVLCKLNFCTFGCVKAPGLRCQEGGLYWRRNTTPLPGIATAGALTSAQSAKI